MPQFLTACQFQRYSELSTDWALEQVKGDDELIMYVPDIWMEDNARVSKDYLFKLLLTMRQEYMQHVISHAYNERVKEKIHKENEEPADLDPEIANIILNIPYFSCKSISINL